MRRGDSALQRVESTRLVVQQSRVLGLQYLTVEVGELVIQRVLVALSAFAFVSRRLESPAQHRHASAARPVALVGVLECIRRIVLTLALVKRKVREAHIHLKSEEIF